MQKLPRYAAIGALLLAAACDAPTSAPNLAPPEVALQDLQFVARSFSIAMQNDQARLAVRDALRDSPWNEHKLAFQEFLGTDAGRTVLAAAAAASGESTQSLLARAQRLPSMELYVPSREQRLSWRGTGEVAVAATLDLEATTVPGFTSSGGRVADALTFPADAVLLLAPAELRTRRLDPQATGIGETIQSRNESEETETLYTWISADGEEITVPYQDLVEGKDSRFSPLMNHTSGSGTYVQKVAGYMQDGSSNYLELGIIAKFYAPDGSQVAEARWKKTNIPRNTLVTIGEILFATHSIPDGGVARIQVQLWELDNCANFCNDDNPYGTTSYYYNDRDVVKAISCPSGSSVCSYNALTGNVSLHWTARSASVFTAVQVSANGIFVGSSGTATAKAVDQYGYGLTGYSVSSWSVADPSVAYITSSNGTSAQYYGASAGYNTISATINGVTGSAGFYVEEYTPPCDPSRPWEIC